VTPREPLLSCPGAAVEPISGGIELRWNRDCLTSCHRHGNAPLVPRLHGLWTPGPYRYATRPPVPYMSELRPDDDWMVGRTRQARTGRGARHRCRTARTGLGRALGCAFVAAGHRTAHHISWRHRSSMGRPSHPLDRAMETAGCRSAVPDAGAFGPRAFPAHPHPRCALVLGVLPGSYDDSLRRSHADLESGRAPQAVHPTTRVTPSVRESRLATPWTAACPIDDSSRQVQLPRDTVSISNILNGRIFAVVMVPPPARGIPSCYAAPPGGARCPSLHP
jgi:hypothetical protein